MTKPGRNDVCQCGSGKKYKKCCERRVRDSSTRSRLLMLTVGGTMLAALAIAMASFAGLGSSGDRIWDPAHGHYHNASGVEVP